MRIAIEGSARVGILNEKDGLAWRLWVRHSRVRKEVLALEMG